MFMCLCVCVRACVTKGDEVVADWYSEIKDYDFRNSDRSGM